jgi:hypothetical protein
MPTDIHEQIERRRERAREEILKIANKVSHPAFSPPLSAPTGLSLLETVRELVGWVQEQVVKASI